MSFEDLPNFDDLLAEELRDPWFRFWWIVYQPRFWVESVLLRWRLRRKARR